MPSAKRGTRLDARWVEHYAARSCHGARRQILAEAAAHETAVAVMTADLAPDGPEFGALNLLLRLVNVHNPDKQRSQSMSKE